MYAYGHTISFAVLLSSPTGAVGRPPHCWGFWITHTHTRARAR